MTQPTLQTPLAPMAWPDPPTDDVLQQPRRSDDLLAYWEWWLYNEYQKAYWGQKEGVRPVSNKDWMERLQGFAHKLSNSAALQRICVTQCRKKESAHHLIALLFVLSDLATPKNALTWQKETTRSNKRAPIEARSLLRHLNKLDKEIKQVSAFYTFDYERAALSKILDTWRTRATSHSDPGPSAIPFCASGKDMQFAPSAPNKAKRSRPELSGEAMNTYLSQVRALVRKAYRERNSDQLTLAVVRQFSPGLLGTDDERKRLLDEKGPGYAEKKLDSRLRAFAATLAKEPAHLRMIRKKTQQQFEDSLRALVPPPDFASASSELPPKN
jgi:hypothetical protein